MDAAHPARNVDAPMHLSITAIAGLAALFAASASSNDMLRGQWQQDTSFRITAIDGKAPAGDLAAEKQSSDRSCYDADETRSITRFLQAGVEQQCAGLTISANDGNLSVSGTCRYGDATIAATGSGSYSSSDFDLTITGSGMVNGHRVAISGRDSGHWLGSCPAA
jgi:hypothetical protein